MANDVRDERSSGEIRTIAWSRRVCINDASDTVERDTGVRFPCKFYSQPLPRQIEPSEISPNLSSRILQIFFLKIIHARFFNPSIF